jgi:hypothetical protein
MKTFFAPAILTIVFSFNALAAFDDEGLSPGLIEKIQGAQASLKNGLAATKNCSIPDQVSCSGKDYCAEFEKNADSPYLYKNAEGKGVPNIPLLKLNDDLEGCFKIPPNLDKNNPLLYPQLLRSAKDAGGPEALSKNRKIWEKENENLKSLVEDTRSRILALFESRKNGKNNAEIEKMKERIKLIRLSTVQEVADRRLQAKAGCDLPNAAFDPGNFVLYVCPQMLTLPSPALQMMLAHEMGHAVDPCAMAQDLHKNGNEYAAMMKPPIIPAKMAKWGQQINSGVGLKANPYSKVISCLQGKDSLRVSMESEQDTSDRLTVELANYEGDNTPEDSKEINYLRSVSENIHEVYDRYGACMTFTKSQQMQEGFSDWLSSQVLKNKVGEIKDPAAAKQFAFESQSFFLGMGCQSLNDRVINKFQAQMDQRQKNELMGRCSELRIVKQDEQHSDTLDRVGRLYLTPKEMQKALNCKPNEAKECQ